jgi:hypothetical protein
MHRDPLQTLVYLVATEVNPHHLVLRVVSESFVLRSVRHLCRETCDVVTDRRIQELCISYKIPIEYFRERLQLIARILNLIPYEQNYYEILRVNRSATLDEIKQSFRRLSFSSHPDTNPGDPDAAERFHNLQHAYEVLKNDKLRQSYDQNLGTHAWTNEEVQQGKTAVIIRWWKWRRAWPVGALLLLLILITLMIDYRQWQTARVYTRVQTQQTSQMASFSSPPPSVSVEPVQEIEQNSSRPLVTASVVEPMKPPSIPEPPSTPTEQEAPLATALIPVVVTRNDETPPKPSTTNTGDKTPASIPATSTRHAMDAKPSEQKLLPDSVAGFVPPTSVEPGGKRPPSDKKPAGPTPAPLAMQQTPPSTKPGGDIPPPVEPTVNLQDLDRKIHWFLARYASTYEAKNSTALFRFFEADAVENGKPIQQLVQVYQANFQRAEKLHYQINVRRWEVGKDGVRVDGSFRLSVQFWDEAPVESTGSIQLTLIRRGDDFGVKRIDYSFRESGKRND